MLTQILLTNPIALIEFISMLLAFLIMTKLGIDIFTSNCEKQYALCEHIVHNGRKYIRIKYKRVA